MITYDRPLKAMNGITLTTENKLRDRNRIQDRKKVRKQSDEGEKRYKKYI